MIAAIRTEPDRSPTTWIEDRYLHPGEIHASAYPTRVTTILGSCVAVCLIDTQRQVAGINHYLLPHAPASSELTSRYGDVAIDVLVLRLLALGARREGLIAKLFGGANVLRAFADERRHIGAANVELARTMLDRHGIRIVAEHVGGTRGRKVVFSVPDGAAFIKSIGP